ncbi:hypothetical protein LNTAR_25410 [Lentisphaera araneosa HTCC2155]|uniref:PIN domain-containing protein n=1 Tax=Lentisphaera araneosa HTCC2155 TaxID=313628 RepID=A6DSC4_9BACT|nr:hypothetical protein [Lentisphaera araneosa]EDM25469.1 hypothetical protein LNTAR_25410 [Lentisphaera araneosa HTCC2155]
MREVKHQKITIYLDNNIWDFLFENQINIHDEFPTELFDICITKEVSFETEAIKNQQEKIEFIRSARDRGVKVRSLFGFKDERHSEEKQRSGGWDEGFWSCSEIENFRATLKERFSREDQAKKASTDLYKNEADIDLAARSVVDIVLSLDEKRGSTNGPLNVAFEAGHNIVFLTDFLPQSESLRNFVAQNIRNSQKKALIQQLLTSKTNKIGEVSS